MKLLFILVLALSAMSSQANDPVCGKPSLKILSSHAKIYKNADYGTHIAPDTRSIKATITIDSLVLEAFESDILLVQSALQEGQDVCVDTEYRAPFYYRTVYVKN